MHSGGGGRMDTTNPRASLMTHGYPHLKTTNSRMIGVNKLDSEAGEIELS